MRQGKVMIGPVSLLHLVDSRHWVFFIIHITLKNIMTPFEVNYNLGMANGPEWYRLLWLRHVREKKGWTDEQVNKFPR